MHDGRRVSHLGRAGRGPKALRGSMNVPRGLELLFLHGKHDGKGGGRVTGG